MNNRSVGKHEVGMLAAALVLLSACQIGCGATVCKRLEADRNQFLARKGGGKGTHLEMTIPFAVAERLVEPFVTVVKPIDIPIPNLGNLSDYFGNLSVVPKGVELIPAAPEYIGFHLDFEIQRNGDRAFDMYLETEVRPEIDLKAGKITIAFSPEALSNTKPGLSKDAKSDLSEMIYSQLPSMARMLIPRSLVDSITDSAVDRLLERFFDRAKQRMLPKLSDMSRFEVALPNLPLSAVSITSTAKGGGRLNLAITTALPVKEGIVDRANGAPQPSRSNVTLRMSGSAAAELVNWALAKGLVPNRYDDKGKPKKDGVYRPGLDWVPSDERPMKIYLWDLEKPCMRITMSAKPTVAVVGDSLEVKAKDIKTDDVDASAFTKLGVWFYTLWKDAMNIKKKSSSKMRMVAAGREIEAIVKKAALEKDELVMEVALTIKEQSQKGSKDRN
jgi:hypothetical protein